jgi:hypothetical protein
VNNKCGEMMDNENAIYNAIIISLVIGIIIVVVTLVIARPEPEYFTELYYRNHTTLPKYLSQNEYYSYSYVINNLENETRLYKVDTFWQIYNQSNVNTTGYHYLSNVTVEKGASTEVLMNFTMKEPFYKVKVMTSLVGKDQEIHFWAYNKDLVYEYPDFIASINCLKPINITAADNFTITAKGSLNPNMKVRFNGEEILSTTVPNATYINITVPKEIGPGYLDIIFDNDFVNQTTKADRNLYIQKIVIGNSTIKPIQGVTDLGLGSKAFDCENLKSITDNIAWNAALRFRLQ